jgi:predicted nucleic acid-binding protein
MVLADTSALYALLDRDAVQHELASDAYRQLVRDHQLVTHAYAVVEAIALTHRRLGVAAVRALDEVILPLVSVQQVDASVHRRAMADLLANASRSISFVDRVSFAFMRSRFIDTAFTLDRDFASEGFTVLPA